MKKKHHCEEQIVAILREADEGRNVEDIYIGKARFPRWKSKYGQMELLDLKWLKEFVVVFLSVC